MDGPLGTKEAPLGCGEGGPDWAARWGVRGREAEGEGRCEGETLLRGGGVSEGRIEGPS